MQSEYTEIENDHKIIRKLKTEIENLKDEATKYYDKEIEKDKVLEEKQLELESCWKKNEFIKSKFETILREFQNLKINFISNIESLETELAIGRSLGNKEIVMNNEEKELVADVETNFHDDVKRSFFF